MRCKHLESIFENLGENGYDHNDVSLAIPTYNCIAWAAGENHRSWWPADWDSITYYWPPHLPREPFGQATLGNFVAAFESLGYRKCLWRWSWNIHWSFKREDGIEKVAIYGTEKYVPTHAVRQIESGEWEWFSKCGVLYEDIKHRTLKNLSGKSYGNVIMVLERRRDGKPFIKDYMLSKLKKIFWL